MLNNLGNSTLKTNSVGNINPAGNDSPSTTVALRIESTPLDEERTEKHVIIDTEEVTAIEENLPMSQDKRPDECQIFKKYLRSTICFFFSHIGLCIIVAAYCAAGAFTFQAIERDHQLGLIHASKSQLVENYSQINQTVWRLHKDVLSTSLEQFNAWSLHVNKMRNEQLINFARSLRGKSNLTELYNSLDKLLNMLTNASDPGDPGFTPSMLRLDLTESGKAGFPSVNFAPSNKTFEEITSRAADRVAQLSGRLVEAAFQAFSSGWRPQLNEMVYNNGSAVGSSCTCNGNTSECSLVCLNKDEQPWSVTVALLYAITVITTIGYGHIVPRTDMGRAVTVLYALIGVPLVLMCMANLGGFLADGVRLIYRHSCLRLYQTGQNRRRPSKAVKMSDTTEQKSIDDTSFSHLNGEIHFLDDDSNASAANARDEQTADNRDAPFCKDRLPDNGLHHTQPNGRRPSSTLDRAAHSFIQSLASSQSIISNKQKKASEEVNVPIWLTLLIIFIYVAVGAIIFANWEDWSLMESGYFLFITLSTIGFGDYVPGVERHESYSNSGRSIFCCFYLLFGLSLVAMSFHLMQENVKIKFRQFAKKIGLVD